MGSRRSWRAYHRPIPSRQPKTASARITVATGSLGALADRRLSHISTGRVCGSARLYRKEGYARQALRNASRLGLWLARVSPERIARLDR